MQYWILGYLLVGILLAEGVTWNKRKNNIPRDVEVTTGTYSVVVLLWVLFLFEYLWRKFR